VLRLDFADSPFFAVLRANLQHLGQRQRLLSENIANAATPGYMPRDTDEKAFAKMLETLNRRGGSEAVALARTEPGHMAGVGGGSAIAKIVRAPDSDTTLDGNAVVLEDQMLKAAETRNAYETSIALYEKGLGLVRMAIKAPNR
jgi:flagellar basal-body rod protein FlgB